MKKPTNGNILEMAIYQRKLARNRLRYAENTIITDSILIAELNDKIDMLRETENIFKEREEDTIRQMKELISQYNELQEQKNSTYYSENDDFFECELFEEEYE